MPDIRTGRRIIAVTNGIVTLFCKKITIDEGDWHVAGRFMDID